jgi:hypothetical protein
LIIGVKDRSGKSSDLMRGAIPFMMFYEAGELIAAGEMSAARKGINKIAKRLKLRKIARPRARLFSRC